jgi:uncharacterized protein
MNTAVIRAAALLALAAILGLLGQGPAWAQNPDAKAGTKTPPAQHKPHRPGVKPAAKDGTSKQNAPEQNVAAAKSAAHEPDLAYAAFQRGFFMTAFALATKRVEEKDDVSAMTLLGELYATGLGVPQNDAKATEWYKFAAARGDRNAMFALAIFSLQGRGGPRDRDASAKWFAAAAKLGHPLAAYNLALLYMEGQLFPQDFGRAAELLRIAAKVGSPEAQYALGTLYKEGRGVPKDMSEAARLWSLAAVADNTDAQVEYAIALYNGDGVAKNEEAAALLFRRAALHGSPIAQDRLARILATGRGAPANAVEAMKWHLISKARGETNIELDDFVNNLNAETRAAGEKAAKPWLDAIKHRSS